MRPCAGWQAQIIRRKGATGKPFEDAVDGELHSFIRTAWQGKSGVAELGGIHARLGHITGPALGGFAVIDLGRTGKIELAN